MQSMQQFVVKTAEGNGNSKSFNSFIDRPDQCVVIDKVPIFPKEFLSSIKGPGFVGKFHPELMKQLLNLKTQFSGKNTPTVPLYLIRQNLLKIGKEWQNGSQNQPNHQRSAKTVARM